MDKRDALYNLLLGLAAMVLVAALAFFYDKTQAVDLREQNEVLSLLRILNDIDGRWDVDVLRDRLELNAAQLPAPSRTATVNKALQDLRAALQNSPSAALSAGLPELSKAILQKAELVEKFKAENHETKNALQALFAIAGELAIQAAELKSRQPAIEQALSRLGAAAPQYYWLAQDLQRASVETAMAQLRSAPDGLSDKAAQLDAAVQALLKHKPAEHELFAKLAFMTSGPRLDALTFSFNRELETALQEKERFRVYLIAYAGALLILLAYLGAKLRVANVTLEHRVEERTRKLSEALKNLKDSEGQLIQSEKMSSLGQMVAGVVHEINTPLAYVKNSLGTVADKLPHLGAAIADSEKLLAILQTSEKVNPDQLSSQFARVSTQIAQLKQQGVVEELTGLVKDGLYGIVQMAEIVANLKDFSRLDRSKVTSFNVGEGLNSTLLLARHLTKTITLDKHFGDVPAIVCSPSQVNQVFLNLITNAVQAMEGTEGTLTISTRRDGDGIAVEFADTGKGIPPEVLPKIFDPFFTTKEVGKGTGLGLSISFKIVEQHGGRLTVESQVGKGTKFVVWLPLKPPPDVELSAWLIA